MSLNKFPMPYANPKNIIIRSKHDASARHQKNPRYPLYRKHSHSLNLSKSYNENGVFTFPFANPFCCLFCNFFLLHNISKHYSVWLMTPVLYNSSPISQKGGVAVLCPVAVLGTFPYSNTSISSSIQSYIWMNLYSTQLLSGTITSKTQFCAR